MIQNTPFLFESVAALGGGESGVGAALLANKNGKKTFLSDFGLLQEKYKSKLKESNIEFEEGGHNLDYLLTFDLVVKSPGISDDTAVIQKIKEKGIPVVSEIEFASWYSKGFLIGITGTNGKTTTTYLIQHLLKVGGKNSTFGGNVGISFAELAIEDEFDYYVLEISSFQLDNILTFRPQIGMILNLTPDHLDRYDNSISLYRSAKFLMNKNQTPSDLFLLNFDSELLMQGYEQNEDANSFFISHRMFGVNEVVFNEEALEKIGCVPYGKLSFSLDNLNLKGVHNQYNSAFAIATALRIGITPLLIQSGLDSFINAPHRLEQVEEINGVKFINDSKATNVDSVYYALGAMKSPIVLILGGKDKGNDYSILFPLIREKVSALVYLGKDNSKLIDTFKNFGIPYYDTHNTYDAIQKSFSVSSPGHVVLLSPACASFDLFQNFEHRGDVFKEEVLKLKKSIR
jgi:UDP-N-acetylmuramoylalanine--D-glutamate ligase